MPYNEHRKLCHQGDETPTRNNDIPETQQRPIPRKIRNAKLEHERVSPVEKPIPPHRNNAIVPLRPFQREANLSDNGHKLKSSKTEILFLRVPLVIRFPIEGERKINRGALKSAKALIHCWGRSIPYAIIAQPTLNHQD
jgi:hypothetical protein